MKQSNYETACDMLEANEEMVSDIADEIFGSTDDLTFASDLYKMELLKERAIFYQEGLKFLNELTLMEIKEGHL